MRALKISLIFIFAVSSGLFAQDENKLVGLSRQIIEAKTSAELYGPLEGLKEMYFKDDKYPDFIDFLNSLSAKKDIAGPFVNYYIALTRYSQLKGLEEKQLWDEYFSKGNGYREELELLAQKAIDATRPDEPLNIYSRLLLWEFHKNEQDSFSEAALQGLMNSVLEYSKAANDAKSIKEAADKLYSYGEKGKAKELYKIYVDKIISSDIKDEALAGRALGFYKEGNLELSETLYDVYVDRIAKSGGKEKLLPVLKEMAKDFSYKDQGFKDPAYAEKLFKRIEEFVGRDVFDEGLMYLRAFNLEKSQEYPRAKEAFLSLLKRYPGTQYADEANFKAAVIYTYILRDIKNARPIFEALAQKESISPQVLSSFYQLGLISQWENDFVKAKEYYNKLLLKAGADFAQTTAMAKERLKEIEEAKPLEYNLRVFLDLSLKEENKEFDMAKINLSAAPYKSNKEEAVNITSTVYTAASGCMEIQLQYLWSGDLGAKQPLPAAQPAFDTTYADKGTKIIGLVVVSPSGVVDRSMTIVDVN
ncbi:MAG: hypothetical protein AABY28_05100 [Candidatus Omnitrophota bacterium]